MGYTSVMLGSRIKFLRNQKLITQRELAALIGVSKQAISHWEKEIRDPNPKQRKKLAEAFGISVEELFSPGIVNEKNAFDNECQELFNSLRDENTQKALSFYLEYKEKFDILIKTLLNTSEKLKKGKVGDGSKP
jgi:transcriptional regulator with XRE-family HTH domain